jgi:glycosyltransferase involved in cell wall biosynthesis
MPYPPKDGGTIGIYNIINALSEIGNDVHLLAMNTPKHFIADDEIDPNIKDKLNIDYVFVDTNISLFGLLKNLLFSRLPYIAERFYDQDFREKLIKTLNSNSFDIIQLEGLYLCLYIPDIRKHSNAKISLRSHNIEHEIWFRTAQNSSNPIKRIYLRHLSRRIKQFKISIINKYDVLVPITERDAEIYNKLGNSKPSIIFPAIVNLNDFNYSVNSAKEISLFHLGALDWFPNQEGLLWFIDNCWSTIYKNHPNLKFNIAGRNCSPEFLKKIDRAGIVFHGEVENAQKFMNDYAVMIVPLLSGSGMRIKIIEGMAMGKAIITTTIGTEGISTEDSKNIMIADTPEELINKIEMLLSNPEQIDKLGFNARSFIEMNYSDKVLANKLTDFYKSEQ